MSRAPLPHSGLRTGSRAQGPGTAANDGQVRGPRIPRVISRRGPDLGWRHLEIDDGDSRVAAVDVKSARSSPAR
jgi:hypothetical protein